MERLTVKAYAKKHKLSIYNVIKMARKGELKSETVQEAGKEVLYILDRPQIQQHAEEEIVQNTLLTPHEELSMLRKEIQRLKKELEQCKKKRR